MEQENLRFYIQTRTFLGIRPNTIHQKLVLAHGPEVTSYSTVQKWSKLFREGRMELEDAPRFGRPVSETNEENIELVRSVIEADPHSTFDDIEVETELSHSTIENIIHDHLKMRKITSRWVPHELTSRQKQERVRICRENLDRLLSDSWRLHNIITGDETWIYLRQIGRKASNAQWIGEGEKPKTVVRRSQHESKMLFSIFFRSNGPLLVHAVDSGQTIDQDYYIDNCLEAVIEELMEQRPMTGTKGIKLLQDNARPHMTKRVLNFLKENRINLMPHPAYSPDLAPCDFWLFDYIKRNLTNQTDEDSLFNAVSKFVFSIPEKEFKKTFDLLITRMRLCIDNKGDYFEHLI
ncbi:MAG: hypothetical protein P4L31_02345 [Candidatus Babeliales bacterium]|nr:hypothetical protein [Candidatus Babeliales bacterium]